MSITASCDITSNATVTGNVTVNNGAILTIRSGSNLNIDFINKKMQVEPQGKVIVETNAKIY